PIADRQRDRRPAAREVVHDVDAPLRVDDDAPVRAGGLVRGGARPGERDGEIEERPAVLVDPLARAPDGGGPPDELDEGALARRRTPGRAGGQRSTEAGGGARRIIGCPAKPLPFNDLPQTIPSGPRSGIRRLTRLLRCAYLCD